MIPPRPRQMNRAGMPGGWWNRRGRTAGRWWRIVLPLAQAPLRRLPLGEALVALASLRQLVRTLDGGRIGPREVVAVVGYRGEAGLLEAFLAHHRRLGLSRLVFLDLSEDAGLAALLGGQVGCTVYRPRAGVAPEPGRVLLWSNALRHRHAAGRWCLSLEATDLLVFSRCETRPLRALIDFLETEHRNHLYALVIEMYGEGAPGEGWDDKAPLERLPLFDPSGYLTEAPDAHQVVAVRGGVRRRTQFRLLPAQSPPLDRVPLVRWSRRHAYVEGTRRLRPDRLNAPHAPWHSSPTACLLRFGLLAPDGWDELALAPLRTEVSRHYRASDDLVECGLLNPGQWF